MIKRLLRRWLDCPTPEDGLVETLEITIRCARRCAYDLRHCASMIDHKGYYAEWYEVMHQKAEHWRRLFQSGSSAKDYRLRLHAELDEKDDQIKELRATLAKHGIPDPTSDVF